MTKQPRPRMLTGKTYRVPCGCGDAYVFCNDHQDKLFEVFVKLGKSGGCGAATMEGIGRAVSVGLRSGVNPLDYAKTLKGIECHRSPSCLTAIAAAIEEHVEEEGEIR